MPLRARSSSSCATGTDSVIGVERDGARRSSSPSTGREALNALDQETLAELRTPAEPPRTRASGSSSSPARASGPSSRGRTSRPCRRWTGEARAWGALGHETALLLETMPKPMIAAVNGFALGGGCELALACDLRYASTAAKLGQPEVLDRHHPRLGRDAAPTLGLVGIGVAKELIMSGRLVDSVEALRIGLVERGVLARGAHGEGARARPDLRREEPAHPLQRRKWQ